MMPDDRLLVGTDTSDDAGVYRLDEETALVQSIDVITPIVDDPYDFGYIAAINALSDIYAMGGTPLTAMTFLAFLLAALLIASGVVKVRSGQRAGLGLLPGTLVELVGAVVLAGSAMATGRLPAWAVVAALGIFFASSLHHVGRLRAIRRRREESEGGRLAAYVKYLSASDETT